MRKQTKLVAVMSAAALLAIGASMTSFAATRGWVEENGVWMYLDSSGDAVSEEWKKSGSQYFWLDENGEMATDALVDDDKYFVDTNGARVINQWRQVDNEEDWSPDDVDESPETIWYYFGSNGKAVTGKKTINGKTYFFNDEGKMIYDWYDYNEKTYYLGGENEGWALTGWNWLEIPEDVYSSGDYENEEAWYYFKTNGEMRAGNEKVYIGGAYYGFDAFGVMYDGWKPAPAHASSGAATATSTKFYTEDNGNVVKGWNYIYTFADWENQDDGEKWFFLEKEGNPFNIGGKYKGVGSTATSDATVTKHKNGGDFDKNYDRTAVKQIKKKNYLFSDTGEMITGVVKVGANNVPGVSGAADLEAGGIYYFNKTSGSTNGQMVKTKASVEYDGDTYYYYFNKSTGKAYTNTIKDKCIYDKNGVRLNSDEGKVFLELDPAKFGSTIKIDGKSGTAATVTFPNGTGVIVNASGKLVEKSTGTKVDGIEYVVDNFVARVK